MNFTVEVCFISSILRLNGEDKWITQPLDQNSRGESKSLNRGLRGNTLHIIYSVIYTCTHTYTHINIYPQMLWSNYRWGGGARWGEGGICCQLINHLHCDDFPLRPQANWHNQVFSSLWKVRKVGADLSPWDKMFQRAHATPEKAFLLDHTSWNNWADGAGSMLPLPSWVRWAKPSGMRWSLR